MSNRIILRLTAICVLLCILLASSACGKMTENTPSADGQNVSETQTYSYPTETEEGESSADKTNRRLPSVPEEMWEHVYLSGRDIGSCLKFCGRNAFLCVFVTDDESTWTESEMDAAKLEFDKAAKLISSEAARYGAEAEAVLTYAEGKVEDPDAAFWLDLLLEDAGYKSESWAREKITRDAQAANGAVVLCFNSKERSYAQVGHSQSVVEMVTLYDCDSFTFAHEVLHLFGAKDLYYPDEVKETSKRIFSDSIMREDVTVVDSLTAYLVGWLDAVDDKALEFLRETDHLTSEDMDKAHAEETYTGYVENRQFDGYVYTGNLKDGVIDGKGKLLMDNGDAYEGDLVFGKEHGYGVYTWADGTVYEGDFVDGDRSGKGKLTYSNGDVYEGDFFGGVMSGYGRLSWISGNAYEGDFVDGNRSGKGKLTYSNGDVYEGEFADGVMSGYGVYRWNSGNVYEGYFENNTMNGTGTLTYADGTVVTGTWENGNHVG